MRAGLGAPEGPLAGALAKYELTSEVSEGNPHEADLLARSGAPSSRVVRGLAIRTADLMIIRCVHRRVQRHADGEARHFRAAFHGAGRPSGAVSRTATRPFPPAFASYIARSASRISSAAVAPALE